jgi:uncharacterized membrane protein YtjA (UPF0391 family)
MPIIGFVSAGQGRLAPRLRRRTNKRNHNETPGVFRCEQCPQEELMANFGLLHYAIVFLVVALVAAAVGFGGVAGVAMEGARLLFWIFIVLFVLSLVASLIRRT